MTRDDGEGGISGGGLLINRSWAVMEVQACAVSDIEVVKETGERVTVKQPFTVLGLCIGCGICVNKCPVQGDPGVRVVRPEAVPAAVRQEYEALAAG